MQEMDGDRPPCLRTWIQPCLKLEIPGLFSYKSQYILYFLKNIYLFIWLSWVLVAACGIYFPDEGSNPGPLHWEHGVLTAGPPRKSQESIYSTSHFPLLIQF